MAVHFQIQRRFALATVLVLLANLVSFGIFWVLKFLIFNRIFHVHPLEELDELVEAA